MVLYGAIIGDFEVSKYTTISGLVSEAVAYLAFWMFTQAKNQLNRYSSQLRENEKVLCAITIIEKIDVGQKKESIDKILEYLLKKEDG